jgi:hypothetical protein
MRKRANDVYHVEAIQRVRTGTAGTERYRVRWSGFGPDDDTREPHGNLPKGLLALFQAAAALGPVLSADDGRLADKTDDEADESNVVVDSSTSGHASN